MFKNEDVIIDVLCETDAFSSTSPTFSIMQKYASAIEQTYKMHNAPTHNKEKTLKHTKTKQIQLQAPKTKNK
jgi:hypothetical protein